MRKIVRDGNSKMLNLGHDLADALDLDYNDEVEIVALGGILVMRKSNSTLDMRIVESALARLDKDAEPNKG